MKPIKQLSRRPLLSAVAAITAVARIFLTLHPGSCATAFHLPPSRSYHPAAAVAKLGRGRRSVYVPSKANTDSKAPASDYPSHSTALAASPGAAGGFAGGLLSLLRGAGLPVAAVGPLSISPSVMFALASLLPACLGFWRTGYTVSYAYGGAMLASGIAQLFLLATNDGIGALSSASSPLAAAHAFAYIFYGTRLCLFLLNREIKLPVEIHGMKRRDDNLSQRLKRAPLILGCSALFYMISAAPMKVLRETSSSSAAAAATFVFAPFFLTVLKAALVAVGFSGFLLAAVGDYWKARIKFREGPDKLVTTGPFRYFRHPNYTGEMIGWTCLCLLLPFFEVASFATQKGLQWGLVPWLLASSIGWAGMVFPVLMKEATVGLEKKQYEKYGHTNEYKEWIKTSWSGPMPKSV